MICLETVEKYCQEYRKIENYDQAVADETQCWHCHHRHEIDWALPREELIAIGRYYDVHYSELIFLTPEEHRRLHQTGKRHTEEWKQKKSESMKGENHPNYGKEGYWKGKEGPNKGKQFTEETKQKMTKYHISCEELYDLYIVQGLSTYKIAELYGCCNYCIWLKLKKYNISKSNS